MSDSLTGVDVVLTQARDVTNREGMREERGVGGIGVYVRVRPASSPVNWPSL